MWRPNFSVHIIVGAEIIIFGTSPVYVIKKKSLTSFGFGCLKIIMFLIPTGPVYHAMTLMRRSYY